MDKKVVTLDSRWQMKNFQNPLRQGIVRLLRLSRAPMSAKELSDRLLASPSAIRGHLEKLVELGLVEVDHTAQVRGAPTVFYRDADVEVRLAITQEDGLRGEREALAAKLVDGTFRSFLGATARRDVAPGEYGALFSGVLHLREEERRELFARIRAYLTAHDQVEADTTEHWEYALIAYRAEGD